MFAKTKNFQEAGAVDFSFLGVDAQAPLFAQYGVPKGDVILSISLPENQTVQAPLVLRNSEIDISSLFPIPENSLVTFQLCGVAPAELSILLCVDFLDDEGVARLSITAPLNHPVSLLLPAGTRSYSLAIRLAGSGSATLHHVALAAKNQESLEDPLQLSETRKQLFDALDSLRVEKRRHANEIARLKKDAVNTGNRVKNTLSFRLGDTLISSVKSPKRFLMLPWSLWCLFSQGGKPKKSALPDFTQAKALFFNNGAIVSTLAAIDAALKVPKVQADKTQQEFVALVQGLDRLFKNGCFVPPRQPDPLYLPQRGKLLYCLHQSVPHTTNGYATRSHGIACGLQANGWEVCVATRTGYPWDAGVTGLTPQRHQVNVDGVDYVAVAGGDINKTPLDRYMAEAADQFLREAQAVRAELIVAASNHTTALPALIAARRLGIPFVYEVRGLWEVTEASTNPDWQDSDRYKLAETLESLVAREADVVLTLTDELAAELIRRGVAAERIAFAPNAVDAEVFSPRPAPTLLRERLGLPEGVPVIGYAGSAVAYEGLELLLESLKKLQDAGIEFRFLLLGDGKVMDSVLAKAAELAIEAKCIFAGRVPFEQVPDYIACMDIMPVPRLSLPVTEMVSALKPLEAMAMGRAVVLSDVAPHLVFAGNNERALLFAKDDADALFDALATLIASPELRQRLGQAAREWIIECRTWGKVTADYSCALRELLSARSPHQSGTGKRLDELRLGIIADRFTTDALQAAVDTVPLSVDRWHEELAAQPIDALLVESAWKGNGGQWLERIGHYSDELSAPLGQLVAYCRKNGIPTLFWNKEDPVHFERFKRNAALFDHVFSTDSRRIIPYLSTLGAVTTTASAIPFFASPAIHNLLPSDQPWDGRVCYGGTYYGKRYPERSVYMDRIISAAAPWGLVIYDRQHHDPESPYKYPAGLDGYVKGALDYSDMIQAYKRHPVHINVNSVLDSPTMFSRRVVEAAASGALLLSGPALGVGRYLDGAGAVVSEAHEAAEWLEKMLENEPLRWQAVLKGHRAVMRAHTTEHRLVQMLRTAGLVVHAPAVPRFLLLANRMNLMQVEAVARQSCRPDLICVSADTNSEVIARLGELGMTCTVVEDAQTLLSQLQRAEVEQVMVVDSASAVESWGSEEFEDLLWVSRYAPVEVLGRVHSVGSDQWRGVLTADDRPESDMLLLRVTAVKRQLSVSASLADSIADIQRWAQGVSALALRRVEQNVPARSFAPHLLVAGHDLKFIRPFYPYFRRAGFRLLVDHWHGHSQHDAELSQHLLLAADRVFCEWMLGNAVWYGKNKMPHQKLVGRLHAQEIRSPIFDQVPFENFASVAFVGPHILDAAAGRAVVLKKNGVVIPNGVDLQKFQLSHRPRTRTVLGLVGIVPQSKRLDRALDILGKLREVDPVFTLRIRGKRPEEYAWMANRSDEMAWYETQYRRIAEDPLLQNAVFFDSYGDDMDRWYGQIDFTLSVSDHESFHLTVADGGATGAVPVILPWPGSDQIYPAEWIVPDVTAAAQRILRLNRDESLFIQSSGEVRQYIERNFSIENVARSIISLIA